METRKTTTKSVTGKTAKKVAGAPAVSMEKETEAPVNAIAAKTEATEPVKAEPVKKEAVKKEAVKEEAVKEEAVKKEPAKTEAIETKAGQAKAIETKKDTTKAIETRAAVLKAPEPVKEEPRKTAAKKAAPKKAVAKSSATQAAAPKRAVKKAEVKTELFIQFSGEEYTEKEILLKVKEVWTKELKNKASDLKEVKLYLKPEEFAAYYVINGDTTGKIDL